MAKQKRTLSPVTRAIQALGMSPKQFVEEKLGIKYPTYQYRVNHGVLRLEDYQRIMFWTGKSFEDLWPSEWSQKSQRIPINLSKTTYSYSAELLAAMAILPAGRGISAVTDPRHYSITLAPSTARPAPQENKKKEETFSAPPAPEIESPYDGLPPID